MQNKKKEITESHKNPIFFKKTLRCEKALSTLRGKSTKASLSTSGVDEEH